MGGEFPAADGVLAGVGPGSRVAGYVLEEQVGAGGMAVVFRARDVRLGRRVAVKVLAPALASDAVFRRRFVAESRAAAAVDEPHIIPVHEAGESGGVLFIAMRYVPGRDVRGLLAEQGALPPDRVADIVAQAAAALDAAHEAGLVHRDVKPANMLLDARPGRADHVYLSDFGLVATGLTGVGQFLGTPTYTPPEQIEGRQVDGRTDEYALACAAFEMLAGAPPFDRDQGMAVVYAQLSEPPPPLTARRPGLAAAVDAVFARALAKAPGDRYPTCGEFAAALRQALGVVAPYRSDPGPAEAQAGREPTEVATVPPAAAGPGGGPGGGLGDQATLAGRGDVSAAVPPAAVPGTAVPGTAVAGTAGSTPRPGRRRRRRVVVSALAGAAVLAAAAAILPGLISHGAPPDPRLIITLDDPGLGAPGTGVVGAAFSPDGGTLAAGDRDGHTYLYDVGTGTKTATLPDPGSQGVSAVAFSPDGHILAAGDTNGRTYLWKVATRSRTATLANPGGAGPRAISGVAFSPDGHTLAAGDGDGHTYLYDVATGAITATLPDPGSQGVSAVAFSPDGHTLAAGDDNGRTYLWDVATRIRTAALANSGGTRPRHAIRAVAFSPDGHTLAAGDGDGHTYLYDVSTDAKTATLADPGSLGVSAVAYSPDGHTLAAGDTNGRTYLWDVASKRRTATFADDVSRGVNAVAFSPDGHTLAAGDDNASTYLWTVGSALP